MGSRGVDDSQTRQVEEAMTLRLAESGNQQLSYSPSFLLNIQKPTLRLGESPSWGVVFRLQIRSQKRIGAKGSARDL
jgi:hypothetical protein